MVAPLALRVLGTDLDLRFGDDPHGLRDAMAARWACCARRSSGPAERGIDVRIGHPLAGEPDPDLVVDPDPDHLPSALTRAVTYAAIEAGMGRLLMLHAAGLSNPATGAAAVFVAPGGTGKSTLCCRLGPGRRYLSDETVGLTTDGSVVGYAKPVSVRRDFATKDEIPPADLGLSTEGADPWLAALVLLRRDSAHVGPPRVEELPLLDALVAISPESSSLDRLPRPLHLLAGLVERTRPVLTATYAEAETLEPLLTDLVGAT